MVLSRRLFALAALASAASAPLAGPALAQRYSGPGVTPTEIRIGNTAPYSGPASAYSVIGRTQAAYYRMINERGGINGRQIRFISYDDAYQPPKAVEQTRKLVEGDDVLAIAGTAGTPSNVAIQVYLNGKKVPQLFATSGASRFGDHAKYPWSIGYNVSYASEGEIYGKHIVETLPDAKIAVLYQNDDSGRDYINGLEKGLGARKSNIVVRAPHEASDPTIDNQAITMFRSGAEVVFAQGTPRAGAQLIRKAAQLGWKPKAFYVIYALTGVSAVLEPAGLENAAGIISATWTKDVSDPAWKDDEEARDYLAFMAKYYPDGDTSSFAAMMGYVTAQGTVRVLEQAGDDLTRENVMRQALALKDVHARMLLPGISMNTSPTNHLPIRQMRLMRFDGRGWQLFGPVVSD